MCPSKTLAGRSTRFAELRHKYIHRVSQHFHPSAYPHVPPNILLLRTTRANRAYLARLNRAYFVDFVEDTDECYDALEAIYEDAWLSISRGISIYNNIISTVRSRMYRYLIGWVITHGPKHAIGNLNEPRFFLSTLELKLPNAFLPSPMLRGKRGATRAGDAGDRGLFQRYRLQSCWHPGPSRSAGSL